ncbi:epigen-like [Scomber scombrus]|uniref:Epigen-like n=1 Tax=Scomber scombrus TaxID=13677 RepID=A0AAV1MVI3_SCOSC|nr:epigen-like [Scomber scombrus]
MFTQGQLWLEKAIFAAVAVVLFATAGQSAVLTDNLQTTTTPALSDSSLTTQLDNSSVEGPRVLRSHRSCESEHENYCGNGGKCMYPQDSDQPSCICTSSYTGPRCMFYNQSEPSRVPPELEQLIAIGFGVTIIIIVLALIIYCFAYKRCVKSAQLIKTVPSEMSV